MPKLEPELRNKLLHYYVENATGSELSDWLRGLGQEPQGNIAEKRQRVFTQSAYLTMPVEQFPEQTRFYLDTYREHLEPICELLGLNAEGTQDARYRRIMREVGYREGWLTRFDRTAKVLINVEIVRPFIEWYPISKRWKYEKDFYPAFAAEMIEIFGDDFVHEQYVVAHGTALKIDFHLGHPKEPGVGVEFKMPTSNAELQRGIGQLTQYKSRYGDSLILVLLPDFIDKAQEIFFTESCQNAGVSVLIK